MVHSDKWFLQSTCPTDKCIQFEISKPGSVCINEDICILFFNPNFRDRTSYPQGCWVPGLHFLILQLPVDQLCSWTPIFQTRSHSPKAVGSQDCIFVEIPKRCTHQPAHFSVYHILQPFHDHPGMWSALSFALQKYNSLWPGDPIGHQESNSSQAQVIACFLVSPRQMLPTGTSMLIPETFWMISCICQL